MRARWTVGVLSALALTASLGCKSNERVARTQILVSIDGDTAVRMQTERLRIELSSGPSADALEALDPEVVDVDDEFTWPFTMALVPGSSNKETAFEVKVIAEGGGDPLSEARARTAFLEGKTLLLEIRLTDECLGYFDCSDAETCVAESGAPSCVSADIDPADLPPFDVIEVDGGTVIDVGDPDGGTGSGSDGGGPEPGCEATGNEQCFNGEDDDCDGEVDCADDDCDTRAVCVPHGDAAGLLVGVDDACPAEFDAGEVVLHRGLSAADCEGCACDPAGPDCFADVYFYASMVDCTNDTDMNGGTKVGTATFTCTAGPIGDEEGLTTPNGWRVGNVNSSGGLCDASGTATPGAPSWESSGKLCLAGAVGGGCATDEACAPRVVDGTVCTDLGSNSCPSWAVASDWYEDFTDTRECGACTCAKSGASCDGVTVELGNDWSCGDFPSTLQERQQDCTATNYSPPARITGTPTPPTCEPSASLNGSLDGVGRHDLCCLE